MIILFNQLRLHYLTNYDYITVLSKIIPLSLTFKLLVTSIS